MFNDRERIFNLQIAGALEMNLDIFLPQRDGTLLVNMIAAGVPAVVAEQRVFQQDCEAMRRSEILIAVLDGGHIDEGVAFEIGFMCALGRVCVGLQTDVRRALPSGNNPMLIGGLSKIFSDLEGLTAWVQGIPREQDAKRG
ncbi:nucleoside 2-deoxyribosyltransferase [Caulobacter ginsengisoli]|uniref:Nucleoside 2-deoxyribosyltransferase n=1 Tax=Caulobacter ginsengisoli TaxID=400775 RepID=A0ABU0INC3_9CAUL|nr:nucleoside 2-deoxyribosyltransferase [Caulobacter ginsengisoli]